jgi:hypothetical protein
MFRGWVIIVNDKSSAHVFGSEGVRQAEGALDAKPRTPEEILSHPQFAAAKTVYIDGLFSLYENNPFMNRLLIEATRSIVFFTSLAIWADYEPDDRATWPTVGLL